MKVTKEYIFDGPSGKETLGALFEGRSQLIVYHFMFAPESEAGCPHCSLRADGFNGINVHLMHRDVTIIAVSRAPYEKLAAYKLRMGWGFKWVSCGNTDFNFDFHFAFTPAELAAGRLHSNYTIQNPGPADREGHSVFYRTSAVMSFTPIPATCAAMKSLTSTITTSISCQRAATRMDEGPSGCADMTST